MENTMMLMIGSSEAGARCSVSVGGILSPVEIDPEPACAVVKPARFGMKPRGNKTNSQGSEFFQLIFPSGLTNSVKTLP
jgi:hypothetical protein